MDAEKIALRLIELRGNRTIKEVADANGISVSALAMYEAAKRIPRDEIKLKLAKYYGVDVAALFFE